MAYDGKEEVTACGEALLDTLLHCTELMESIVRTDRQMPPQTDADMLRSAIQMYDLVHTEHDDGKSSAWLACLHMLRSCYLWLAGDHGCAFCTLDAALEHAVCYDRLRNNSPERFSSPLLRNVEIHAGTLPEHSALRKELPDIWPWWCIPEQNRVKAKMQADPRWNEWKKRQKHEKPPRRRGGSETVKASIILIRPDLIRRPG